MCADACASAAKIILIHSPPPLTRHSLYHSDKLSRLALPSELIECHSPCEIRSLARCGRLAPMLPGDWR